MADEREKPNFWATLPGILTGIAAVLTAAGGIILALHQIHASTPAANQGEFASPTQATSSPSSRSPASTPGSQTGPSEAPPQAATTPSQAGDNIPPEAVRIVETDGTVLWSFEDKLYWGNSSLTLDSGQTIAWGKMKMIEVLGIDDEGKTRVRVTLTNGKVIEAFSRVTDDGLSGQNDIGGIYIDGKKVRRVIFPR
jgi:hypothetical protein